MFHLFSLDLCEKMLCYLMCNKFFITDVIVQKVVNENNNNKYKAFVRIDNKTHVGCARIRKFNMNTDKLNVIRLKYLQITNNT